MTNIRKNDGLTDLSVAVAPARDRHRDLIEAAVDWLADRGRVIDPDHLALICAGVEYAGEFTAEPPVTLTRWTRMAVYHMVRCDIPNWCSAQRCPWPLELPQVMWAWFDFLHGTGRLDRASEPVAELRKPLACYGWLDQDGRPLPPDAPREILCECLLPYRETVELLDELVRQCERAGQDPMDRLRGLVGRPPRRPSGVGSLFWRAEAEEEGWSDRDELMDLDEPYSWPAADADD